MTRILRTAVFVLALTAWLWVWLPERGGFGPCLQRAPFEASGRLAAEQALACLKPGGQILVLRRDTSAFSNPATDAQMAAFRDTIRRARACIQLERVLPVDPLRPVAVPSSEFCDLLKNSQPDAVIVSFMGPPILTDADLIRLGEAKRLVIAFCPGPPPNAGDLKWLFDQGLLEKAIVMRPAGALSSRAASVVIDVHNLTSWQGGNPL